MSTKGLVAICISTYQKTDYIKRLLDSIKIQTYKEFIVVISDDTEDSSIEKIVTNYKDIQIDYHRNSVKLGPTCNTNNAIELAQKYNPEFIKVMHHDDCFSNTDSLQKMVEVINGNLDADLVFAATIEKHPDKEYIRLLTEYEWKSLKEDFKVLYIGNYIGAPSATIVRNNGILMDSNLVWYVDIEWYLQILNNNRKIIYIKEPLITVNHSETQVTKSCIYNPKIWIHEAIYIYKKWEFLHEDQFKDYLIETLERQWNRLNIIEKYRDKKVYIYGAGILGQDCAEFLKEYSIDLEGFIVSDGQKCKTEVMEHKVYALSEIVANELRDVNIILALNKKNKEEVIDNLNNNNLTYISYS